MDEKRANIFKTLSKYKKVLEEKGYNVIYIGLYGSQNYNLDDEESDIDAKAIIMPSLHDIIFRKVTSTTVECEEGNIDVKDLLTFYDVIKKGNFSYIESIQTKYSIGDKYIKELFYDNFSPNLKSILGAMYEKRKALTHPYPSKVEEFKKWGFDPKQLHHIFRLYDLLRCIYDYHNPNISYIEYYIEGSEWRKYLLEVKRNTIDISVGVAEKAADSTIEAAKCLIPKEYEYKYNNIDQEINDYIEKEIKKELRKTPIEYAREIRTFDNPIPKSDIKKFPLLEQYQGEDVSYIVYESMEFLGSAGSNKEKEE